MDVLKYIHTQWDRVAAWVCIALGGLLLLLGWQGVSGALLPTEQTPYLVSDGLGGLFLLGLGAMLWLSADLRDEWRKLDRIERCLRGQVEEMAVTAANGHASQASPLGTATPARR